MPSTSEKQHNAMEAAAHGHSTLGIPEKVGKDFSAADKGKKFAKGGAAGKKMVEHPDHFLVTHQLGHTFKIAKRGLHPSTVKQFQKMCEGGEARAHYDGGTGPGGASQDDETTDDATTLRHDADYDPNAEVGGDLSERPTPEQADKMRADERSRFAAEQDTGSAGVDPRTGMGPGVDMPGQEAAPEGSASTEGYQGHVFDQTAPAAPLPPTQDQKAADGIVGASGGATPAAQKYGAAKLQGNESDLKFIQAANEARDAGVKGMEAAQADKDAANRERIKAEQDLEKWKQDQQATINKQQTDLRKDIADGKIDPDKYWHDKGTGGRIAGAIGIMLSGFGAGMSNAGGHNASNMAMDLIQKNIDRDIDAQKANLHTKESLLADTYRQTHDLNLSVAMTRQTLQSVALAKLEMAAGKSNIAAVKANAGVANQQALLVQNQGSREIVNKQAMLKMQAHNMNVSESNKERLQTMKSSADAKLAQDLEKKRAEQAQKGVSDRVTANQIGAVKQASKLLLDMAKPENTPTFLSVAKSDVTPGARVPQKAQGQLDTLRSELGKVATGGVPSDTEDKILRESQPKVGGVSSGDRWHNYVQEKMEYLEGQAQAQNKAFREASGKNYDVHPEWEPGGELWKQRRMHARAHGIAVAGAN